MADTVVKLLWPPFRYFSVSLEKWEFERPKRILKPHWYCNIDLPGLHPWYPTPPQTHTSGLRFKLKAWAMSKPTHVLVHKFQNRKDHRTPLQVALQGTPTPPWQVATSTCLTLSYYKQHRKWLRTPFFDVEIQCDLISMNCDAPPQPWTRIQFTFTLRVHSVQTPLSDRL